MAGLYQQPPLTYTSSFDRNSPKLAIITINNDGNKDSMKVPMFTEKGSVEELLYCKESFEHVANCLQISNENLINYFIQILVPDTQTKWHKLVQTAGDNLQVRYSQANNRVDCINATKDFSKFYYEVPDAKYIMHTYLISGDFKKPQDTSFKDHVCLEVLMNYTEKLHGHCTDLTTIIHSPSLWVNDYGPIHHGVRNSLAIQFVVKHMQCLERDSKTCNKNKNKRKGNNNNNNNNNKQQQHQKNNDKCNKAKGKNPFQKPGHDHDKNYKHKNQNNNTGKNGNKPTAQNTSQNSKAYQAHMRAASAAFHAEHGNADNKNVTCPVSRCEALGPAQRPLSVTMPPSPLELDAGRALLSGMTHGGELPQERKEPTDKIHSVASDPQHPKAHFNGNPEAKINMENKNTSAMDANTNVGARDVQHPTNSIF
eukprot:jgi/Psemu1/22359/gm1.22359_g